MRVTKSPPNKEIIFLVTINRYERIFNQPLPKRNEYEEQLGSKVDCGEHHRFQVPRNYRANFLRSGFKGVPHHSYAGLDMAYFSSLF